MFLEIDILPAIFSWDFTRKSCSDFFKNFPRYSPRFFQEIPPRISPQMFLGTLWRYHGNFSRKLEFLWKYIYPPDILQWSRDLLGDSQAIFCKDAYVNFSWYSSKNFSSYFISNSYWDSWKTFRYSTRTFARNSSTLREFQLKCHRDFFKNFCRFIWEIIPGLFGTSLEIPSGNSPGISEGASYRAFPC